MSMGDDQFVDFLFESNVPKQQLNEELWDSAVVRPSAEHDRDGLIEKDYDGFITNEQKWDESVKARYGGDELWESSRDKNNFN